MVMTDGVFSMGGQIAPSTELAQTCVEMGAWLVVDGAHGFGVFGENAGGIVEQSGLSTKEIPILMATFVTALGTSGAFIAGDKDIMDLFLQSARTFIYSTAPPPAISYATIRAFKIVREESWR